MILLIYFQGCKALTPSPPPPQGVGALALMAKETLGSCHFVF